jgi:thiol-disulfide isomerase/thioredoxin
METRSVNRRQFLTYLSLGTLGLGTAIGAQPMLSRALPKKPQSPTQSPRKPAVNAHDMPEFQGISTWLNSKPLTRSDLQGQVVLIHIWTLGCINCQRTLPSVVQWHKTYASKGLKVIGVHTPEFPYERDLGNIKQALKRHDITYPIAIDNDYKTWGAYQNSYWPHLFLADRRGVIQYDHIGEGAYPETEQKIRDLLAQK